MKVPYFRPEIGEEAIQEVAETLRSGWLTTGPRTKRFESEFAQAVGAREAIALNSCTAALHLAVEALGLLRGQAVLVPTLTFAATAEVVRYLGAVPVLVDCDPVTLHMDLDDAETKLAEIARGRLLAGPEGQLEVVGMIPVHVGGLMMDVSRLQAFAERHGLWLIEDAAHSFPAAWRPSSDAPWQRCGEGTAAVTCFSFYANKTITTGEGGMAVTDDPELAERMRTMSLHGLSRPTWDRHARGSGNGTWDYRIVAPGFKYNLTDVAAAVGIHQLARSRQTRFERQEIAHRYSVALADLEGDLLELPPAPEDRLHSWHLYPLRLHVERLSIDRDRVIQELAVRGVGSSVHWRPLHLHPYYQETFGWVPGDLPTATEVWLRLVSLPLFPSMTDDEVAHVAGTVREVLTTFRKS